MRPREGVYGGVKIFAYAFATASADSRPNVSLTCLLSLSYYGGAATWRNFWLRLTTASAQCLRLSEHFFH